MILRLFSTVPSIRLLLPYMAGMVFVSNSMTVIYSMMALALWCFLFYYYFSGKLPSTWSIRWMPGAAFAFFWFSFGGFAANVSWSKSSLPEQADNYQNYQLKLESDLQPKKKSFKSQAKIINSKTANLRDKVILLYFQKSEKSENLKYGDIINAKIRLQEPQNPSETAEFDYKRWLRTKGICATAYVNDKSWHFVSTSGSGDIKYIAKTISDKLLNIFETLGLKGDNLALISAMTIGTRSQLDKDIETDFRYAGVSHILSVSGLHVGVIYGILQVIFFFMGNYPTSKKIRQIIIVLLLWIYAFVTGLSASVNRSAMMFSLISLGVCLEKRGTTLNIVVLSAFILLIINPLLLYDVGFQLSYAAVTGIVVLYPALRNHFDTRNKVLKYIRDLILISIVAQISTSPIAIYYFKQFPNYFLLGNLVAVPVSGVMIMLSVASLIFSFVPILNQVLVTALNFVTDIFITFTTFMGDLPYAVTDNINMNLYQVLVLYMIVFMASGLFLFKRKKYLLFLMSFILVFQVQVLWGSLIVK